MSREELREIERLNWTLTAITNVNSALVRATTEHELYQAICRAVTYQDTFALAWVGIPQCDQRKTVKVFASAGKALPYLDNIEVTWGDDANGNGPSGRAVKSGLPQFNNDMFINAQFQPWRDRAMRWNLKSSFSLPIKLRNGHVVAVLMVYSEAVNAFGEREFQFLSQLGSDISYGVEALRTQLAYSEEMRRREQAEMEASHHLAHLARLERVAVAQSLTTTLAHEINQPLGAILGNAEAAQIIVDKCLSDAQLEAHQQPFAHEMREILTDIRRDAQRASDVVRNLRNLVTAQQGQTEELCVNQLVVATCRLVQADLEIASISLRPQLEPLLPRVCGNAVQLQQVLLNLLANARDALVFSKNPQGLITVVTQIVDSRWIRVLITDNGPGISDAAIGQIAKPLFTTKDGGTGVGLWLCSQLIRQLGGELSFWNVSTGGACFSFTLPSIASHWLGHCGDD